MQGNENKNMKTRIQTKRANKHNRVSCLISTSISFHSMLFSNYQNCRYVVYKFVNCVVWFVIKGTYGSPLTPPSNYGQEVRRDSMSPRPNEYNLQQTAV